jgi:Cu(I)/Ag(I) efflux system membrane protein CusA/SilA
MSVDGVIEWCARHRLTVLFVTALAVLGALHTMRGLPLDAIPDLSDPQVVVTAEWMGRGAELIEDQVTYPLVTALRGTPKARAVRGFSMFGMSFVYTLFDEGTDLYWARARVAEAMGRARLPSSVVPQLGPDATGVGWVFSYALTDPSGAHDLSELRQLQDWTVRSALESVPGVAEVAAVGGYEREVQITVDPQRLRAQGVTLEEVAAVVRRANLDVGGGALNQAGREYAIQARGLLKGADELGALILRMDARGTPLRLADVATIAAGGAQRRGIADLDGQGEVVGGIVVMRDGENALDVINRIKARLADLRLPEGVSLVTTYDRSVLIDASIATLTRALLEEALVVSLIVVVFLLHFRSALVAIITLPVAVLLAFIPMRLFGLTSNIMSLGGIAIAIGAMVDACVVLVENAHKKLEHAGPDLDTAARTTLVIAAAREVGRPIFFSLLLITVSFLPVFTLEGQGGRLFIPLALTKTASMFFAAVLSITLAPALMVYFLRGRIRSEQSNPVSRFFIALYRPFAWVALHNPRSTVLLAVAALASAVPLAMRLGSEFMPPLDEGSLMYMPTTLPGISAPLARDSMLAQDRILKDTPEVERVFGKVGRADSATDPAPLDMVETVITLKPREQWRMVRVHRFHDEWPEALARPLRWLWPNEAPITREALLSELNARLAIPGWTNALVPPIKTRIDMLTTGIRTPVGIQVQGDNVAALEKTAQAVADVVRQVPGARGVFAERVGGATSVEIRPDPVRLARYGLNPGDLTLAVETALGGAVLTRLVDGRARVPVTLRYPADTRDSPEALRRLLIPLSAGAGGGGAGMPPMGGALDRVPTEAMLAQNMPGMNMGGGASPTPAAGANAPTGPANLTDLPGIDVPVVGGGSGGVRAGGMGGGMAGGMAGSGDTAGAAASTAGPLYITLGEVADVDVHPAPAMLKDVNGQLSVDVYVDVDPGTRDLGGFVTDAKARVEAAVTRPAGVMLHWTGQYEQLERMTARLQLVVPLTLLLVIVLLYLNFRSWARTFIVLLSVPFALVGSVWLLFALGHPLSTAVWVGLIALVGVAAETGIVMLMYLDEACDRAHAEGRLTRSRGAARGHSRGRGAARAAQADDRGHHALRSGAVAVERRARRRCDESHRGAPRRRSDHLGVPHAGDHPGGVFLVPRAGAADAGLSKRWAAWTTRRAATPRRSRSAPRRRPAARRPRHGSPRA